MPVDKEDRAEADGEGDAGHPRHNNPDLKDKPNDGTA